ncbi:ADP-ribosylglycohydrolase family protein [Renibacterium salmoninarum]|nr:ADP-ribosylglycohydrolase family protein [Renibacterium salmoninarum]
MQISFPSRVRACLMGGALGDSFGYLVETDDLATIQRNFGPAGLLDLSQVPGAVHFSDDTQLTLYTADGLTEVLDWAKQGIAADPTACLWLGYLRWLRTQGEQLPEEAPTPPLRWIDQQEVLQHRRHPGNACLTSLKTGAIGTLSRPINREAKGCGTVMSSAPFGLIPHIDAGLAARMSMDGAALTHGHPIAIQASAAFSWLIHQLAVVELSLGDAADSMLEYLESIPAEAGLLAAVQNAVVLSRADLDSGRVRTGNELNDALGDGWVAEEALSLALYAAIVSGSHEAGNSPTAHFLSSIRIAANHRGDSDSTAAIAGNIIGARYGIQCLPEGWLRLCEAPELIYAVADALLDACSVEPAS